MRERMKEKVLEVKRNLILEGVSDYFEEIGFHAATMQEIATHLGLSVGALYKFFASKDELFYGYISYQINLFYEAIKTECEGIKHPKERLEIFVQRKFETFQIKRSAISDPVLGDPLFFLKLNTSMQNPSKPIVDLLAEWFHELMEEDRFSEKDPQLLSYLFSGHTTGYVEYWLNGGTLTMDAKAVVKVFFEGIKERS